MAGLALVLAAALWGVWGFANKLAVSNAHPFSVQWMYAVPFIVFIPLWYGLGARAAPETNLSPIAFGWAAGASAASIVALLLMFYALRSWPASVAVAITAAYPVVTLLIAVAARHERLDLPKVLGIGLVVAGIIVLQIRGEGSAG